MVVRDTDFLWTGSYVIYFLLLTYPLQQALYVPFSDFSLPEPLTSTMLLCL